MIHLYLQLLRPLKQNDTRAFITLESLFPVFVYRYLNLSKKVQIVLVLRENEARIGFWVNLENVPYQIELNPLVSWVSACELPSLRVETIGISGFCCVCRQLIKSTDDMEDLKLLGFRQRSLNTPSDASPWTKLCEIELPNILSDVYLTTHEKYYDWNIPEELLKLEMHLSLPLKIHNMPKYLLQKDSDTEDARFIDSHQLTILDIIVWVSYMFIFERIGMENLKKQLSHTIAWHHRVSPLLRKTFSCILIPQKTQAIPVINCKITKQIPKRTFYKIESKREGVIQKFTAQKDIDSALEKILPLGIDFSSKNPADYVINFDWQSLPTAVNPFNGALPNKRMLRKQQQLESMAIEVVRISKKSDIIVDFCCGTGHLGILIACLLPQCQIILLDNNEESLVVRARAWVTKLGLTNISFFLGNINYFNGNFNTGVSLHACGSATDIVLRKCWQEKANFICSPCCYGKINENNVIKYPQSKIMKGRLDLDDFLTIAHSADQGHEPPPGMKESELTEQAGLSTDIIDTDRKMKAEELGYSVVLKRLHPESCTPKNRLLIGVI